MYINNHLTWDDHVHETCKRASKRLRILRVLKPLVTPSELHAVYVSTVRGILEYSCVVFVGLNVGLSKSLQRIDKRAHRIIHSSCGCDEDCLSQRRKNLSIKMLAKCYSSTNHILREYLPPILPHNKRLRSIYCRTERRQRSFFPFTTELYNKYTQHTFQHSLPKSS